MRIHWRDVLCVMVGGGIGYQLQVASIIEGNSMLPTFKPGQKLFHLPYWALGWWCWPLVAANRLANGTYKQIGWQWDARTKPVCGDIVLATVDEKGTTVCKRVVSETRDFTQVTTEWEAERFRPDGEEEDVMEDYIPYNEVDEEDLDANDAIRPVECPPNKLTTYYIQQLPRRSHEWDTCRQKGFRAMANNKPVRWLWLEGDNKLHSFDSRQAGAVPDVCLKGRVLALWWPLREAQWIAK